MVCARVSCATASGPPRSATDVILLHSAQSRSQVPGPRPRATVLSRALRGYFLSAAAMDGGFFLIMAAMPFKVLALGGGAVDLGLMPTIGAVSYVLAAPAAGVLSDRTSRIRLCGLGGGLLITCAFLALQTRSLTMLLALQLLMGLGKALYWPTVQSSLGDLATPATRQGTLGRFNVAWSSGKTLGFLLGGLLLHRFGFAVTFLVGAVSVAAAFFALPRRVPASAPVDPSDAAAAARNEEPSPDGEIEDDVRHLRRLRTMAWIANTAAYGAFGILTYHLPQWFESRGWSEAQYGFYLAGILVSQTLVFVLLLGPLRVPHRPGRLWLPQGLAAAALVVVPILHPFGLLLLTVPLVGLGCGIAYAASLHFSLVLPAGRGRNAGIHEALVGAGGFLPPLLAGLAVKGTGMLAVPYPLAAGLLLLAVGAQMAVWHRP